MTAVRMVTSFGCDSQTFGLLNKRIKDLCIDTHLIYSAFWSTFVLFGDTFLMAQADATATSLLIYILYTKFICGFLFNIDVSTYYYNQSEIFNFSYWFIGEHITRRITLLQYSITMYSYLFISLIILNIYYNQYNII